ncbi:MAG: MobA/MobL family protein [Proteobacteria bacterium]|nr:MobA/MobL family protein [Pseudomonadota bacterium]
MLTDKRTGLVHDFRRRGGVDSIHTLAPVNAPDWVNDPSQLWNEVERAEKRKDAQTAREINIALPRELDLTALCTLTLDYARAVFVEHGMVAQVAFHDIETFNPHAHIMLTTRTIGPDGFGGKERTWNDRQMLDDWRREWEQHANRALEQAGVAVRIDCRSLEAQGIEREATQHLGPKAAAMEARGVETHRKRYITPTPEAMSHTRAREDRAREQKKMTISQPEAKPQQPSSEEVKARERARTLAEARALDEQEAVLTEAAERCQRRAVRYDECAADKALAVKEMRRRKAAWRRWLGLPACGEAKAVKSALKALELAEEHRRYADEAARERKRFIESEAVRVVRARVEQLRAEDLAAVENSVREQQWREAPLVLVPLPEHTTDAVIKPPRRRLRPRL